MLNCLIVAAVLFSGNGVVIEGGKSVDPGRQITLKVSPKGIDLRDRFRGFAVADDYDDEKENATFWLLTPSPCEEVYKIAPFAYNGKVCGPVYFDPPAPRETVTGGMECDPEKDLPPITLRLIAVLGAWCLALGAAVALIWFLVRLIARTVKEHRMSPIERAWVELDRLIAKGLPGRGRYKDFYVELTMVVRRYVQRKYGIKAPHLTTEEFLREVHDNRIIGNNRMMGSEGLKEFLESADMVKFAGVKATPEMADSATESARGYLKSDDTDVKAASPKTNSDQPSTNS